MLPTTAIVAEVARRRCGEFSLHAKPGTIGPWTWSTIDPLVNRTD
jgi:hypothetical protein